MAWLAVVLAFFILAACNCGFRNSAVIATARNTQNQQPSRHDAETARGEPDRKEETRDSQKRATKQVQTRDGGKRARQDNAGK